MAGFVISPPAIPSVAVKGTDARFAVRRIFCVGRNYAAHAREMGKDPDREPPFFFTKPADAVVDSGTTIPYPAMTENLHHEIELVVAIGRGGVQIAVEDALDHVWGYGVGIDLTRRDVQDVAKKLSRPWDWAKAFDNSAPCGALVPVGETGHPSSGKIRLSINGEEKQCGDLDEMIWPVADIIALCSGSVALQPGDLIFTGTPAGVGVVSRGDQITGSVDGIGEISLTIGS